MPSNTPQFSVLIAAAGESSRFGGDIPKPYCMLGGLSILERTVQLFEGLTENICVVIAPGHDSYYDKAFSQQKPPPYVFGGKQRSDSIKNGLEYFSHLNSEDKILIHDAARPFVPRRKIIECAAALERRMAASLAIPARDTLRKSNGVVLAECVDRGGLWALQTPQGFRIGKLREGFAGRTSSAYTDETTLISELGTDVHIIEGDARAFKITYPDDMELAKMMTGNAYRTGSGFDVHGFNMATPGPLRLCGIDIPHPHPLKGHSDADVALHALTDAILGSIAAGDIGQHFPPSDEAWKGKDSRHFVEHALNLLKDAGGALTHIDITIIGEAPKISPHRDAMRESLAALTALPLNAISLKATTTEGLGALGRGEGLAAQALVTVKM